MKRIKTLLAMLLCVAMLLSSAALAGSGTEFSLNDILCSDENGEPMLDLGGVGLNLGFAENDDAFGLHLGLNANNESVADIQLALQGSRLLMSMDGVSNVYSLDLASIIAESIGSEISFSEADLEALTTFVTDASTILASSVVADEADSTLVIDVTGEQMDALLAALATLLDTHPELFAGSGYNSFSEIIAGMDCEYSLYVEIAPTDAGFDAYFTLYTDIEDSDGVSSTFCPLILNVVLDTTGENDSDQYTVELEFIEQTDPDAQPVVIWMDIDLTLTNDQFDMIALNVQTFVVPEGYSETDASETEIDADGFYFAYASAAFDPDEKWNLVIGAIDDSVALTAYGNMSGGSATLNAGDDTFSLTYEMENGEGVYKLVTEIDGVANEISANGKLYNTEGEWLLPAETEAIDLMTLDEDGMNTLMMEALSAVMNALSTMGQANVLIGELVGSLMS